MATVANGNKTVKAAVLLDDGSSSTFCTLNLAQKLQLPTTSHQRLSISHFGSEDKTDNISPITLKTNEGHVRLKAIVLPKICTPKTRQTYRYRKEEQLKDKPIVESVNEGNEIDLLIASDFYYSVVKNGIIRLDNGTVAVETKVGYLVCSGQHSAPQIDSYFTTAQTAPIVTDEEHVKEPQQLFESIQDEPDNGQTHGNHLDDFRHTLVQNSKTGQYTASLPWTPKCDKSKISTNRHIAYHRARNIIQKKSTDKQLFQKLKDFFADYQRRGFVSLTTNYNNYNDDNCNYLPGMPSTKIIPFTPKSGLSLMPVAKTNDSECHSTTFSGKDPI